jgi:hypothetical protein
LRMRGGGGERQHGCKQAGEQSIHLEKASLSDVPLGCGIRA